MQCALFLGGAFLLVFGLAFYAVLRRARRVSMGAAGRLTAGAVTVHPVRVWGDLPQRAER